MGDDESSWAMTGRSMAVEGEVRRIADEVRDRILAGTYPTGLRLPPEASLSQELGCGRSTLREALRLLATMGLVQSRRGSGVTVLDWRREGSPALLPAYVRGGRFDTPPADLARELLHLRTMLASEAVRLAARHVVDPARLAPARARLERAPSLEDDPAAHALNELELYRELVVASQVWPAVWMVNSMWAPLREMNAFIAPLVGPVDPRLQGTLERLLELVEAGQGEAASGLVRDWFTRVDAKLVRIIERTLAARD